MVTLDTVCNSLAAYGSSSEDRLDTQVATLVHINAESQPGNEEAITGEREDLPVESLCEINVFQGPFILFCILHDYLVLKGPGCEQRRANNRVDWGLSRTFYTRGQECEYVSRSLRLIDGDSQFASPNNLAANTMPSSLAQSDKEDRVAHNIVTRFKSIEKFTAELGKDICEHMENYLDAANDYR